MSGMNTFEFAAREIKVSKILEYIPHGATPEHNLKAAALLETFDAEAQDALARRAGLTKRNPKTGRLLSNQTWALVVQQVRERGKAQES